MAFPKSTEGFNRMFQAFEGVKGKSPKQIKNVMRQFGLLKSKREK